MQSSESCDKCFDLEAELLKKQNAYNELLKSYSQLEKHYISLELTMGLKQEIFQKDKSCDNQNALEIPEYFENNDLKAQLQAKYTTIRKLKEHIKSMRENDKEEKVKEDIIEIETINIELEHNQFDSIKKTRVRYKEHSESLIAHLNSKSVENADLKSQIQDKVFVITLLKNNLRKLKGKEVVDNAAQMPNATTMFQGCKVFTKIGYKWKPTRRLFTLVGNICHLTRFTSTKVVPLKETTYHSVETHKPKLKVCNKRPKLVKSGGSSKKSKIVDSRIANNSKPNHSWGSNATDVPSSSSLVNDRLSRLFSGIWTLDTQNI
ncbi:hypothetical protein Tco_0462264 [Tanacetum coccineum]